MTDGEPSTPNLAPQPLRRRVDQVKLTPLVFVAFFAALALMSGAAALVGYVSHSLSHTTVRSKAP